MTAMTQPADQCSIICRRGAA